MTAVFETVAALHREKSIVRARLKIRKRVIQRIAGRAGNDIRRAEYCQGPGEIGEAAQNNVIKLHSMAKHVLTEQERPVVFVLVVVLIGLLRRQPVGPSRQILHLQVVRLSCRSNRECESGKILTHDAVIEIYVAIAIAMTESARGVIETDAVKQGPIHVLERREWHGATGSQIATVIEAIERVQVIGYVPIKTCVTEFDV